jgi:Family of unknown function (DUF5329)
MKHLPVAAFIGASMFCLIAVAARSTAESARIDASLARMDKSDLVFIRNGSEHTGKAAADHMRTKLNHAGDSIKTFDEFIDKVATRSSMSGKPYLVKFKDGKTVELAKWLRETPGDQPAGKSE